ncbi:M1 family metallopeptidase [Aestuariibaculum lutulentum]|uniref:M1 family metallopeptidase n=1 Tax=Aestuariibaculum lutulentum TaxID=2920935 RepID=A0ABS9RHK5_9FLAO|nr:M1 family metallopeptidase [Aestuariibaculum lutulentum]MCH4552426.1 M1 family metallopeptidase [Aestuariibaculum lutulentum]
MNTRFLLFSISFLALSLSANAQLMTDKNEFTQQDTLRGSITPERSWWDLTYYHLDVEIAPDKKFISGKNTIQYKVLERQSVMQIDLQEPLKITKVTQNGKSLKVFHNGNAHFVYLKKKQEIGKTNSIEVYYEGNPKTAVKAPWDGGFSWKTDKHGNPFVATSCQGLGASVWWPCKDHMYDEVDSMDISVTVPKGLMDVSNGQFAGKTENETTTTYNWTVKNPINNYGVNANVGDYVHFTEIYEGEKGPLKMDYYVLRDNLEKAKEQFKQAPKMMKAFEYWFGPYPFYEDGFKIVETPYLGMEHQSSVTYGNGFKNGYLGRDLSGTGWGLKFDFIIVHESGHEWFANNITYKDAADMWIHESFTNYSESLYLEYYFGKEAASEYVIGIRKNILNDKPIIGPYNVNKEGSGDMYYKGANMIHTLRQLIEDDEKFRNILRGMNETFYHQTVTTQQIENYISKQTGYDLQQFFDQYLRTTKIPTLEYSINNKELKFRWTNIVEKFDMPVLASVNGKAQWIYPKADWKTIPLDGSENTFKVDPNFYIETKKL